jgi:membrane-associated phospholipid phosphatase
MRFQKTSESFLLFSGAIPLETSSPGAETQTEAALALRLFQFNWVLIAGALVVFELGLLLTDFRLQPRGYLTVLAVAAVYGLAGHYNATSHRKRTPRVSSTLTALAQMILIAPVLTSTAYIAMSMNLPMQDANLLALDRAAGLDFLPYMNFINDRPWLVGVLATTYRSIQWQTWLIVIGLPVAGYYRRVGEFICAFLFALAAAGCISALMPATGVYGALGLVPADYPNILPQAYYDTVHEVPALRDGSLRLLDVFRLGPVLTFPSFHAVCAILFIWSTWPWRWLRSLSLVWNGAMLVSTPVGGGHYFVDVIAGAVIAGLSIYAATRISSALAQQLRRGSRASRQVQQPDFCGPFAHAQAPAAAVIDENYRVS